VNKQWNLDDLELALNWDYDEIIITGGEPMLRPNITADFIETIKAQTSASIYLYTAMPTYVTERVMSLLDGLTVTLHDQSDVLPFLRVASFLESLSDDKSMRLNIFKGVKLLSFAKVPLWQVKDNIEWIKDCPLPENEVFQKYILF
jgi:organic radical activating enzyme